jgi:hypothetical protein
MNAFELDQLVRVESRRHWSGGWQDHTFVARTTHMNGNNFGWEFVRTLSLENAAPFFEVPLSGGFNPRLATNVTPFQE